MAIVKFTRTDGHPAIEIKALNGTEEAFLAEFEETGRQARFKPNLQYSYDGKRTLGFGWKSRVSVTVNTNFDSYEPDDIIGRNGLTYQRYVNECINRNIKTIKKQGHLCVDEKDYGLLKYILIAHDTRKAWFMRYDSIADTFDIFIYEPDLTQEKYWALAQKLGISKY